MEQMPTEPRPLLAGDHTAWPRSYARTLRDRTIEHQPTLVAGNKPIAVGHGFSTIAWIPEAEGSWALPLRHERITSFEVQLLVGFFNCILLPIGHGAKAKFRNFEVTLAELLVLHILFVMSPLEKRLVKNRRHPNIDCLL